MFSGGRLDKDERALLESFERGEWQSDGTPERLELLQSYAQAAARMENYSGKLTLEHASPVQITLGLIGVDDRDRLRFSKQVLPELRHLDAVVRADRTEVLVGTAGIKGFETLLGFLTAEVTRESLTEFFQWMGDRFADKALKVKVKVGEREIQLEATSRKELDDLEQRATRLLIALADDSPNL